MTKERFSREFGEIMSLVEGNSRFLVMGHIDPDGDCIGSMFAIALFLESRGKEVRCFAPGDIQDLYRTLPGSSTLVPAAGPENFGQEVIFALDSPTTGRMENLAMHGGEQKVINIDHHPSNQEFGIVNVVDDGAAATTVLVYRFLSHSAPEALTPDVASCLYLGILMDTGGFRFQNTDSEAMFTAGKLLELGARAYGLTHDFLYMQKFSTLKLLAPVLESLEVHFSGKAATMTITLEMLDRTGASFQDSEGFIDYAAAIDNVELIALFREIEPRRIRVSLRSRNHHDVASIAEMYGGGGHSKAAGLTIEGGIVEAKALILDNFGRMLNPSK